jgi:hypothetical protein
VPLLWFSKRGLDKKGSSVDLETPLVASVVAADTELDAPAESDFIAAPVLEEAIFMATSPAENGAGNKSYESLSFFSLSRKPSTISSSSTLADSSTSDISHTVGSLALLLLLILSLMLLSSD